MARVEKAACRQPDLLAEGLDRPFGIAFYPAGPNPQWVYVAATNSVVRYPYKNGDLKARGAAKYVVPTIAPTKGGNHVTRDLVFSADGKTMFVSAGSASNVAETMGKKNPAETQAWAAAHALGAAWGREENRADVLAYDPAGKGGHVFAAGIRNCVSMAINPAGGALWCVTNERDLLGDNLPPDYATHVRAGAFYGWPWYYIGANEDPRRAGERPDLRTQVTVPDVLIQPHSAPLGVALYEVGRTRIGVPGGLSRSGVRGAARLVEPGQAHGLQGGDRAHGRRQADRRIHRLPDRFRGRRPQRLGAAGGRGRGPRRRAARHRRRRQRGVWRVAAYGKK